MEKSCRMKLVQLIKIVVHELCSQRNQFTAADTSQLCAHACAHTRIMHTRHTHMHWHIYTDTVITSTSLQSVSACISLCVYTYIMCMFMRGACDYIIMHACVATLSLLNNLRLFYILFHTRPTYIPHAICHAIY